MATAAPVPEPDEQLQSSPLSLADDALAEPSILDQRRFWANHAGQSIEEIAKSTDASEAEVTASILRVRNDNSRYSATAAGVEARKIFIHALPRISSALDEALVATRLESKKVVIVDKEAGTVSTTVETVERPDHDTRLQAIDRARSVFSVVQPRDPAVQIVSNSQTNILNQGGPSAAGAGAGHGALTSPEAVIRSIVAQRALALTDGKAAVPVAARLTTLEGELMAAEKGEEHEPEDVEGEEESEDDEIDDDEEEAEDDAADAEEDE